MISIGKHPMNAELNTDSTTTLVFLYELQKIIPE
jgi:hypothetical protein